MKKIQKTTIKKELNEIRKISDMIEKLLLDINKTIKK